MGEPLFHLSVGNETGRDLLRRLQLFPLNDPNTQECPQQLRVLLKGEIAVPQFRKYDGVRALLFYLTVQHIEDANGRQCRRKVAAVLRTRFHSGRGRKRITSCLCGFFARQA